MDSQNINAEAQERRRSKRVRANLTVFYRIKKPLVLRLVIGGKEVESRMLDLSEGGISLSTDTNIEVGTMLIIRFTLFKVEKDINFSGPMEIIGEVKNNVFSAGTHRIGVSFSKIGDKDKAEIGNFIKMIESEK